MLDLRLLVGADHHDVDHPRDHARGVLDRLGTTELRVTGGDVDDRAAELVHPGLERHAGARRRLLEDHRQCPVAERLVELVPLEPLLDPERALEQVRELGFSEVAELQEMLGRRRWRPEQVGLLHDAVANSQTETIATTKKARLQQRAF